MNICENYRGDDDGAEAMTVPEYLAHLETTGFSGSVTLRLVDGSIVGLRRRATRGWRKNTMGQRCVRHAGKQRIGAGICSQQEKLG
jgi:hypothetical protein